MDYHIRPAAPADLPAIEALYAGARAFMVARGNPDQWGAAHPPRSLLERDIRQGVLYVLTNGETIHGAFALVPGEDPTYGAIYGGFWHSDTPYAALHRVAGDGSRGIFAAAVAFARERFDHLRVDTHEKNLPMRRAIARAGFCQRGTILTDDGTPRLAFDWLRDARD